MQLVEERQKLIAKCDSWSDQYQRLQEESEHLKEGNQSLNCMLHNQSFTKQSFENDNTN